MTEATYQVKEIITFPADQFKACITNMGLPVINLMERNPSTSDLGCDVIVASFLSQWVEVAATVLMQDEDTALEPCERLDRIVEIAHTMLEQAGVCTCTEETETETPRTTQ